MIASVGNTTLEEIRRICDEKRNGVLCLIGNSESIEVFYREGIIDAVSSTLASNRLGQYFLKEGYIDASDLEPLLSKSSRQKTVLGEAAISSQHLDAVELAGVLRLQALDLLNHAIENGFSRSSFTPGLRSFRIPAQINFQHLLLELSRNKADEFERDSDILIVLREDNDLSGLSWYPQELFVLNSLHYPITFANLQTSTDLPEANLRKILGVFADLGLIETLDRMPESGGSDGVTDKAVVKRDRVPLEHLIPVTTGAAIHDRLEVLNNASSFVSEQFRNLKIRLTQVESENPIKVITITSPNMQDGKSLVTANLALSFSMDPDRRVIVVDCDLRNPSLDAYLAVSVQPGLLQYLDNGHLGPYCYVRRLKNLYFLTAGGTTENPVELLSLNKMKDLIEYLKRDFDTIILDVPPLSPIPDARIVSALSDGLILVVRMGKTPYARIENAFKVLDRNKLLGVVLNDVESMPFNSNYNSYYEYGSKSPYVESNKRRMRPAPKNYLGS